MTTTGGGAHRDILIRTRGQEFRARDAEMLRQWCAEGRIPADALVLLPGSASWVPAAECEPVRMAFDKPRPDQVEGDWHVRVGAEQYVAPDFETLKGWHRSGRIPRTALIYHQAFGGWLIVPKVVGLETPSSRILHRENVTYRGGIRGFPKEQAGVAYLTSDGFEFHGHPIHFDVAFDHILALNLDEFRPSAFRVMVVTSGPVPLVKNVVALTYVDSELVQRTAEFQMHGAMTLQGEGEKAAQFVNRINDFKHRFSSHATATNALDPAHQLRELKELLDAGALTPAEFEAKKQELLRRI